MLAKRKMSQRRKPTGAIGSPCNRIPTMNTLYRDRYRLRFLHLSCLLPFSCHQLQLQVNYWLRPRHKLCKLPSFWKFLLNLFYKPSLAFLSGETTKYSWQAEPQMVDISLVSTRGGRWLDDHLPLLAASDWSTHTSTHIVSSLPSEELGCRVTRTARQRLVAIHFRL